MDKKLFIASGVVFLRFLFLGPTRDKQKYNSRDISCFTPKI